jgi:hypothetical protein
MKKRWSKMVLNQRPAMTPKMHLTIVSIYLQEYSILISQQTSKLGFLAHILAGGFLTLIVCGFPGQTKR